MISLYCWNAGQAAGLWLSSDVLSERLEALQRSTDILWIDLENPTPDEEQLVLQKFLTVHQLTLEDITKLRREPDAGAHFPKVEEFEKYLFVVVNPLTRAVVEKVRADGDEVTAQEAPTTQLSAVLTRRVLITHHYQEVPAVTTLRGHLQRHEARAQRGPDYLFHIILDSMVDEYAPVLDHVTDALEEFEGVVIADPSPSRLAELLHTKRFIASLRKTMIYEREVLARLQRGEFELIDEVETAYYRNVYDHLIRFTELIENSREMVSDLMQTHLSAASNRLNEIVKVLTMISTIILPMTLIAGIFGMNFEPLPTKEGGFWYSILMMLATGVVGFTFFKWRKWI